MKVLVTAILVMLVIMVVPLVIADEGGRSGEQSQQLNSGHINSNGGDVGNNGDINTLGDSESVGEDMEDDQEESSDNGTETNFVKSVEVEDDEEDESPIIRKPQSIKLLESWMHGNLLSIWHHDVESGTWNSYFTRRPVSELNDLLYLDPGQEYWFQVSHSQAMSFKPWRLDSGWSLVTW